MSFVTYFFRTIDIEYIRNNSSDVAVVFLHGILSETKKAFKLAEKSGYFWDEIRNSSVFGDMDFVIFSYGRIDLSNLTEMRNPFNTLNRISDELYGYLSGYKDVILIGHSQGGLLAKTYATSNYLRQGIYLTTLHTPHRNSSFSVMRYEHEEKWNGYVRFVVPHLFCASINDRKIVKPDNAFYSAVDETFLSKKSEFSGLGHSHLSSSPDPLLLRLLSRNVGHFLCSGHSKSNFFLQGNNFLADGASEKKELRIYFSRSRRRIETLHGYASEFFLKPLCPSIEYIVSAKKMHAENSSFNQLFVEASSINYVKKSIIIMGGNRNVEIKSFDSDFGIGCPRKITNDYLCEKAFSSFDGGDNPYKKISFDAFRIKKKYLIDDLEFIDLLCATLDERSIDIRGITYVGEEYDNGLFEKIYIKVAKKYFSMFIYRIFDNFSLNKEIGFASFRRTIKRILKKISSMDEKRNNYQSILRIINMEFYICRKKVSIADAEYLIARLMKSDGDLYWLDKMIGIQMRLENKKNGVTITRSRL